MFFRVTAAKIEHAQIVGQAGLANRRKRNQTRAGRFQGFEIVRVIKMKRLIQRDPNTDFPRWKNW